MIWEHVRRYVIFWAIVAVLLVIATFVVYGEEIVTAITYSATSTVESIITVVVIVGIIVMMVRG